MKKLPKEIYILGGFALILCLVIVIMSLPESSDTQGNAGDTQQVTSITESTTESSVADVEPVEMPENSQFASILGIVPAQVDRLTDKYVLRYVLTTETGVEYYYQQHLSADGQRLVLKIDRMSQEEYEASLPAESVAQHVEIAGRNLVFADRFFYKMTEGTDPGEVIQGMVDEGTAVLGESEIYNEASELQTLDWYENGCRYEIYADFMGLTLEDMTELAQYYFDNAQ